MTWIWLLLLAILCAVQLYVSSGASITVRVLLIGQAVFVMLGYGLRSLVLMMAEPMPALGDSIADSRLLAPSYAEGLDHVLPFVVSGQATFVGVILLSMRYVRFAAAPDWGAIALPVATLLYAVGWLGRGLSLVAPGSGIVSTVALAGSVGAIAVLIGLFRPRQSLRIVTVVCVLLLELIWSLASESKTPVLAVGLGLLLATMLRAGRVPWKYAVVGALIFVVAFTVVQSRKTDLRVAVQISSVDATYPPAVQPLLPIVRRFDLLAAVTDAFYFRELGASQSLNSFTRLAQAAVPEGLVGEKVSAGRFWASEVRTVSRPGSDSGVSLAEGVTAEGLVLGGVVGVLIANAALALLILLVGRLAATASLILNVAALGLIASSGLFERGWVGLLEDGSKSVQVGVLAMLLSLLLGARARREVASTGEAAIASSSDMVSRRAIVLPD